MNFFFKIFFPWFFDQFKFFPNFFFQNFFFGERIKAMFSRGK